MFYIYLRNFILICLQFLFVFWAHQIYFNPAAFCWSACTKLRKWKVIYLYAIYICVRVFRFCLFPCYVYVCLVYRFCLLTTIFLSFCKCPGSGVCFVFHFIHNLIFSYLVLVDYKLIFSYLVLVDYNLIFSYLILVDYNLIFSYLVLVDYNLIFSYLVLVDYNLIFSYLVLVD